MELSVVGVCLSGCVDGVFPFFRGDGCKEEKREREMRMRKEID